jgi:hypothetical protein
MRTRRYTVVITRDGRNFTGRVEELNLLAVGSSETEVVMRIRTKALAEISDMPDPPKPVPTTLKTLDLPVPSPPRRRRRGPRLQASVDTDDLTCAGDRPHG